MDYIENRTFDEIKVGDSARLVRTLTKEDINMFAAMSGDVNPAHMDEQYARSSFRQDHRPRPVERVADLQPPGHQTPRAGNRVLGQTLTFSGPCGWVTRDRFRHGEGEGPGEARAVDLRLSVLE